MISDWIFQLWHTAICLNTLISNKKIFFLLSLLSSLDCDFSDTKFPKFPWKSHNWKYSSVSIEQSRSRGWSSLVLMFLVILQRNISAIYDWKMDASQFSPIWQFYDSEIVYKIFEFLNVKKFKPKIEKPTYFVN